MPEINKINPWNRLEKVARKIFKVLLKRNKIYLKQNKVSQIKLMTARTKNVLDFAENSNKYNVLRQQS